MSGPGYRAESKSRDQVPSGKRTEYTSIIALEKLIGTLNPAEISGTVIIIPLINVLSFEQKVPHLNPVDKKSMNRWYPGKMDGKRTDRASYLKLLSRMKFQR